MKNKYTTHPHTTKQRTSKQTNKHTFVYMHFGKQTNQQTHNQAKTNKTQKQKHDCHGGSSGSRIKCLNFVFCFFQQQQK